MAKYCANCGREVNEKATFCRYCGVRIDVPNTEKYSIPKPAAFDELIDERDHTEEYSIPKPAAFDELIDEREKQEEKGSPKTRIYFIAAAVAFIVAVTAIGILMYFSNPPQTGPNKGKTVKQTNEKKIISVPVENGEIEVISSDWDWDSAVFDSSRNLYRVDAIMLVKNGSEEDIVGIDYCVDSEDGVSIKNETDEETTSAYGYVQSGDTGVMVGEVWTSTKKLRPNESSYRAETAYINPDIEGYIVPTGYIYANYGPKNDYYDVSINNDNDSIVNNGAKLVLVSIENNTIMDSDATGRLHSSIEENTTGFIQEKAFVDPNLRIENRDAYTLYVLDVDYLVHE